MINKKRNSRIGKESPVNYASVCDAFQLLLMLLVGWWLI